jgi:MFS transporter, ACS family, hexuronate transporter
MSNATPLPVDSPRPSRRGWYRWVICGLLFLATTIGYIDRQVVAILEPVLKVELGWDQVTYGRIVASFQLAYLFVLLLIHLLLPKLERMELDSAEA